MTVMAFEVPVDATDEEMTDAIEQLHGVMTAAHRAMLRVAARYEYMGGYQRDGARSMAEWLSQRLGVPYNVAQSWMKTASRCESLPALDAAFETGALSFEQVRVVGRLARYPEDAEEWVERAKGMSFAELRAEARTHREDAESEDEAAHLKRRMWWEETEDHAEIVGGFRLPLLAGQRVIKAVTAVAETIPSDPDRGREPFEARCADALEQICSGELAGRAADRATVVIHSDASFIAGGGGSAELQEGAAVGRTGLERLLCDCDLEPIVVQEDGSLGIGRKRRSVPRPLERRIRRRDGGCCFPGCGLSRWTQIHHMKHWTADRGPTNEGNLITLCVFHHHVVHEGGWTARGDPVNGRVEFVNRYGVVLKTGPPPLRPGLWAA